MVDLDHFYMQAILQEAWKYQLLTYPNPAVGAAVLLDGKLLSIAAHQKAGGPHAEVLAIKEAYYRLSQDKDILKISSALHLHNYLQARATKFLKGATLYVTLEPCFHFGKTPPCSLLIKNLGFKRVVIGTLDPNQKASGGASYLKNHNIQVEVGVCKKEAKLLIEPFVKWSRKRFIFFKYAQTLNGSVKGGVISSLASRKLVHSLRELVDLLVIGGNSVRVDRPILDSRLVKGKPPDVLIYSRRKRFDLSIPLFKIPDREVFIEDSLEKLEDKKFIMVEGGEGMLKALRHLVDWYMIFVAPKMGLEENYRLFKKIEFLHFDKVDRDLLVWGKNG
ncbi:MAG: bifunctional diaminohydroxyphosphoribosylaminopyrimidine deaminase/5-amino-6-(5-phosphoribosylamino)uracil reductase RibD [Epsilonproteobacteria bacterium]|nr:bifunctional diaminohydroxyphosphoribosylaminopyrimidine deaminase/5-amino-6-(5-phosphoribosylamino)uracil reductase RibD [Campylobacterota bacterium]